MSILTRDAISSNPPPPLRTGDHLDQQTFHQRYQAMSPNFRAELTGGIVIVPSPVGPDHGQLHAHILLWLGTYCLSTPGTRIYDNVTTILGPNSEVQPDALLLLTPKPADRPAFSPAASKDPRSSSSKSLTAPLLTIWDSKNAITKPQASANTWSSPCLTIKSTGSAAKPTRQARASSKPLPIPTTFIDPPFSLAFGFTPSLYSLTTSPPSALCRGKGSPRRNMPRSSLASLDSRRKTRACVHRPTDVK